MPEATLPAGDEFVAGLSPLGFDDRETADVAALLEKVRADPAAASRLADLLTEGRRRIGAFLQAPPQIPPVGPDTSERPSARGGNGDVLEPPSRPDRLQLLALACAAPDATRFHQARGIPPEISRQTLAELVRQLRLHRRTHGELGLEAFRWVGMVWTGALYQLERLQFEMHRLHPQSLVGAAPPPGVSPGDWVVSVHIPAIGPLEPSAVEASFAALPGLLQHFPEVDAEHAHCFSWLLDPQLSKVLPPTSNVLRFQRLFVADGVTTTGDADVLYFVFGRRGQQDLSRLPRQTRLERAVLERLERGEHWYVTNGWRPIAPPNTLRSPQPTP